MTATDYKSYLAANVLSEDKVITYRLLSRALEVHVNRAKQMLYEFHRIQNAKKPGSVHATYIVSGMKYKEEQVVVGRKDGDDEIMQSSPPFNSSPAPANNDFLEDIPRSTISLVREEHLNALRNKYETITSIHVHSVGPHTLKDMQILSDATREIRLHDADRDLVEYGKIYGTILNPDVRRRTGRRPPPVSEPVQAQRAQATPVVKAKAIEAKAEEKASTSSKSEPKSSQSTAAKDFFARNKKATDGKMETKKVDAKPPTLKRDSSSIFKSFAKAKPKLKLEDSASGAETSGVESAVQTDAEDQPMKDASDDEEDDYVVPNTSSNLEADRKSRKEREDALKRMMEDEDEDEVSAAPSQSDKEVENEPEPEELQKVEEPQETSQVEGGRRRGRRRVTRKKTMKDEEGYLVTKEEQAWESFSEDEPVAPKAKAAPLFSAAKKGKPAAPKGQGSIMSFFGKPKK